jgi:hypothetical protein
MLMLMGVIPPFSRLVLPFPKAWILGLFVLIPSITLYYEVRDRFWEEVRNAYNAKKRG